MFLCMQDEYIQMTMIKPPSFVSHGHMEKIQQLMKLFAVSVRVHHVVYALFLFVP